MFEKGCLRFLEISNNMKSCLQLIATHPGERSIRLNMQTETIKSWLAGYGITQASQAGDTSDGVSVQMVIAGKFSTLDQSVLFRPSGMQL